MHNFGPATVAFRPPRLKPVGVPKLQRLHIEPMTNGVKATHHFTAGPSKQFVFHDPRKMTQHVVRAVNSAWLRPNASRTAQRIDRSLNIG